MDEGSSAIPWRSVIEDATMAAVGRVKLPGSEVPAEGVERSCNRV